jgi:hypothetical protein
MMLVMLLRVYIHVVRHIFQACPVWIYTQSNITSIISNYQYICFQVLSKDQGAIDLRGKNRWIDIARKSAYKG